MNSKIFLTLLSLSCAFANEGLNASSMSTNKYAVEFSQNQSNLKKYILSNLNDFAEKIEKADSGDLTHGTIDSILRNLTEFVTVIEDYAHQKDVFDAIVEVTDEHEEASSSTTGASRETGSKNKAQELFAHIVHNLEAEKGPGHREFVRLMGELHNKVEQIFRSSSLKQAVQSDSITMERSGAMFVVDDFKALSMKDFLQSGSGSACVLYSFLYAVQQHPVLSKDLEENFLRKFKKTSDGEYFIDYGKGKIERLDVTALSKLSETMHPSNNPLLRVIGFYILDRMGHDTPHEYFLANVNVDHKDFFFNQPVVNLKDTVGTTFHVEVEGPYELKEGEFVYKNDGTIDYMKAGKVHKISGEFVVSTGSRGHAVSVFYNHQTRGWVLFDNLKGESPLKKGAIRLDPSNVYQVLIIGAYTIT